VTDFAPVRSVERPLTIDAAGAATGGEHDRVGLRVHHQVADDALGVVAGSPNSVDAGSTRD